MSYGLTPTPIALILGKAAKFGRYFRVVPAEGRQQV